MMDGHVTHVLEHSEQLKRGDRAVWKQNIFIYLKIKKKNILIYLKI